MKDHLQLITYLKYNLALISMITFMYLRIIIKLTFYFLKIKSQYFF